MKIQEIVVIQIHVDIWNIANSCKMIPTNLRTNSIGFTRFFFTIFSSFQLLKERPETFFEHPFVGFFTVNNLLFHSVNRHSFPVHALGNFDSSHSRCAGAGNGHKELQTHCLQSWKKSFKRLCTWLQKQLLLLLFLIPFHFIMGRHEKVICKICFWEAKQPVFLSAKT